MATKQTQGTHKLEITEREMFELRQGLRHREHELELAHNYLDEKGLNTEAPDERLRILRGKGPGSPGLMHKLGFVVSQIKEPPEPGGNPDQLDLAEGEEPDG